MNIGKYSFELGKKPYVMGILNVTPDSFSDGGRFNEKDAMLKHVEEMINDGASIIDVGGESTRPGYTLISDEEEIGRVCPAIELIKKEFDIAVTLDTYKYRVAEAGLDAGADMINDIWGLRYDDGEMAEVVSKHNSGIILMHNRKVAEYNDFICDVLSNMKESVAIALDKGINKELIILDPGIGFAKTLDENLILMNNLDKLCAMGYPVLLGTSRKSMIGLTLDLPKDEREEGTIATSVFGLMKGCDFFRVHDVKKNMRALDMTFAMMNAREK